MLVWEVVEWDEHNEAHATRHGVSVGEIEQVLAGDPLFRPDRRGSGDFLVEGVTDSGRRVRVVVAYHQMRRALRPIAAWEVH